MDALVETLVFRGALIPGDDVRALREIVEVRQALDVAMAERVVSAMSGQRDAELHSLVDEMEAAAVGGRNFAVEDRRFHSRILEGVDNSLVGKVVEAFWDVHSAVLPRLGVVTPGNQMETAHAHRTLPDAAESVDVTAYRRAVVQHYRPIAQLVERQN